MSACRILHVEDEPDIRDVVQLSLALDPQIEVMSYSSAEEALAAAADWRPHGILTDVVMPDDGWSAAFAAAARQRAHGADPGDLHDGARTNG